MTKDLLVLSEGALDFLARLFDNPKGILVGTGVSDGRIGAELQKKGIVELVGFAKRRRVWKLKRYMPKADLILLKENVRYYLETKSSVAGDSEKGK
jgi:hypothetical protein